MKVWPLHYSVQRDVLSHFYINSMSKRRCVVAFNVRTRGESNELPVTGRFSPDLKRGAEPVYLKASLSLL